MPRSLQEIAAALSAEFGTQVLGVTQDEYGNVRVRVRENSLYTREFGVNHYAPMDAILENVAKELGYTRKRNAAGETGDTGWNAD